MQMFADAPDQIRTITSHNGVEFHGYKDIERHLGTTIYFATPHHAWERGTNENTNGLIRQYLPKGTHLGGLTQEHCNDIAANQAIHYAPIEALLELKWSPDQIVGWRRRQGMRVMSHETIYLHIWKEKANGGSLWRYLRGGCKQRRKRLAARTVEAGWLANGPSRIGPLAWNAAHASGTGRPIRSMAEASPAWSRRWSAGAASYGSGRCPAPPSNTPTLG